MQTPSVPDFEARNFKFGDTQEAIEKQNGQNADLVKFGNDLVEYVESRSEEIITAGGKIFDTVEQGREAVSDEQYYYVVSSNPRVSKSIYKRNNADNSEFIVDEPSDLVFEQFQGQRGSLLDGVNLSSEFLPGFYLLLAGNNYIDVPEELDVEKSYFFQCKGYGGSSGLIGNRFLYQEIIEFIADNDHHQMWSRRLDIQAETPSPWVRGPRNNAEIFAQRGNLPANTSLSDVTKPGSYLMLPNRGYTDTPSDYHQSEAYFLSVESVGPTSSDSGYGVTRYGRQVITKFLSSSDGSPRKQWERRFDYENPGLAGGNDWTETRFRFDSVSDDVFLKRGTLPLDADFADYLNPGCWLGLSGDGYQSAPDNFNNSGAFWLEVSATGGRFVKQTITYHSSINPGSPAAQKRSITRRVDTNNPSDTTGTSTWTNDSPILAGTQPYAGKRIICFGDSVTQGNGTFEYPTRLATLTGANVINGGFGGCRMAVHDSASVGEFYDPFCMYQIASRIAEGPAGMQALIDSAEIKDFEVGGTPFKPIAEALAAVNWNTADYVIIAYGTNDFRGTGGMGVPIGNDSDMTGDTFKGAINVTINNIVSARPNIKIMFATPLWRSRVSVSGEDSNVTPNGSGVFLREYADAILERARAYQIPVLDLHDECAINILNWEYYMPDGLHTYTNQGMDLLASKIHGGLTRFYG